MKIRSNTRIMALVLALVMLLPLISIPTFAETAKAFTKYAEDFNGKDLSAVAAKPASAKITEATKDAEKHGDVIQVDLKGMNSAPYYLWQESNKKWPITGEVVDGKISGTANGLTVPATEIPANDDDASKKVTIGGTTYAIVTGAYADCVGGFNNFASPIHFWNPEYNSATSSHVAIQFDLYLSEDFKNSSQVSGRVETSAGNVELFGITAEAGKDAVLSTHENGAFVAGAGTPLKKATWNTILFVIDLATAEVKAYANGTYFGRITNRTALNTAVNIKANKLQIQTDRANAPSTNGGYYQIDNVLVSDNLEDVSTTNLLYEADFEDAFLKTAAENGTFVGADGKVIYASASELKAVTEGDNTYLRLDCNAANANDNLRLNTPSFDYRLTPVIVLSVDYFATADMTDCFVTQFYDFTHSGGAKNWYNHSYFWFHNNTVGVAGTTVNSPFRRDEWNRCEYVIDLENGVTALIVNGSCVGSGKTGYTNVISKVGSLIIGKVGDSSGCKGSGYAAIDNVRVTSVESFSAAFEGKNLWKLDIEGASAPSSILSSPNAAHTLADASETDELGKVIRRSLEPIQDGKYYLINNSKQSGEIKNLTIDADGLVSGTATVGGVSYTVKDCTVNTLTRSVLAKDANGNEISGVYVADTALKQTFCGGGNYTSWTRGATKALDPVGGYGINEITYSVMYYFSEDARLDNGMYVRLFSKNSAAFEFDVYNISVGGGTVKIYHSSNAGNTELSGSSTQVKAGGWVKIDTVINLTTGKFEVYVNNKFVFSVVEGNCVGQTVPMTFADNFAGFGELARGFDRGSVESNGVITYKQSGYMEIGEAVMRVGKVVGETTTAPALPEGTFYAQDFEHFYSEGIVSPFPLFVSEPSLGSTMPNTKLARLDDGNVVLMATSNKNNNQTQISNPAITAAQAPKLVYEFDLYIPADARGYTQTQILNIVGKDSTGASHKNSWNDFLQIRVTEDSAMITREAGGASYAIEKETWITVSLVIDMASASWDVFANGLCVLENQTIGKYASFDSIPASSIKFAKINNNGEAGGAFYFDNVKLFKGEAPSVLATSVGEDFNNATAVLGASVPAGATIVDGYSGNGVDIGIGDPNIDKVFKPALPAFPLEYYNGTQVLEAKYFITEDAKGNLESQFNNSGYQNLYTFNATSGEILVKAADKKTTVSTAFEKGTWITVTSVLNTNTADYGEVYLNGVFVGYTNQQVLANGLQANEWSVIKVMKNADPESFGGHVIVDDLSIKATFAESAVPGILDVETFENGILESVKGASIRLASPTGMRFASEVDTDKLASLDRLVALGKIKSYEMGTLIAPANYVQAAGEFSKEALDTLPVGTAYLDVKFDGVYFSGDAGFDVMGKSYLVGSIVNIKSQNVDREFAGAAYIEIVLEDGSIYSIYADAQIRSVRYVADRALEDTARDWTEDQLNVLNSFATPKQ